MAKTPDPVAVLYAHLGDEHGESLFELLPGVQFWIKDRSGRYIRVNHALLHNYGFNSMSSMIGKTDHDLMPPHLAEQYVRDDRAVLGGLVIRGRIELVARPDHSTGWHSTDKIPLRSRSGKIIATAGITRDLDQAAVLGGASRDLGAVVDHLRAHYTGALDKTLLARRLGRSVRSLERHFIAAFGLSLMQYQRKLRLHQACRLLVSGTQPITVLAQELGYCDHSHFTREFRRAHGLAPIAYRKRWSQRATL